MIERKMERAEEPGEPGIESFTDDQTGAKYRRIVGGLAWPDGGKPGCAVVIAEDFDEDQHKDRHLWVLKELEAPDVAELVRGCQDIRDTFHAREWFGNIRNNAMRAVLYHLQKDVDLKDRFSFSPAPHADDPQGLGYYLPLIKDCLGINRKVLHFGEGSKLSGYLAEMGPDTLNQDPADYPPIAALGYSLSHHRTSAPPVKMVFNPPRHQGPHSWM
jgi:hypothetical protein